MSTPRPRAARWKSANPKQGARAAWRRRWGTVGLISCSLVAACSEGSEPEKSTSPPPECTPRTFSLRSLAGFQQCCEDESPSDVGSSLVTCAHDQDAAPGAGGMGGGAPGDHSMAGLGGGGGAEPSAWVVLVHSFEAAWHGGNDVCMHITSTGEEVAGEAALFTMPSVGGICSVASDARVSRFRATGSATAYVCLNTGGDPLELPVEEPAMLAIAFRFHQGTAEALRVDAVDVKKDSCEDMGLLHAAPHLHAW